MTETLNTSRKRIFAIGAVFMLLFAGLAVTATDDENESQALIIDNSTAFAIGVSVGLGIAAVTITVLDLVLDRTEEEFEEANRSAEAGIVASALISTVAQYENSLSQVANIWPLTNDHWVRQAEMTAASMWSFGEELDFDELLVQSDIFNNIGQNLDNLSSQFNDTWDTIGERVKEWNTTEFAEVYGTGMMSISVDYGSNHLTADSGEDFDIGVGIVLRDVVKGQDQAWLSGGALYASEECTITDGEHVVNLGKGWNTLPEPDEFYGGIWTFPAGVTFCGNIVPIVGSGGAEGVAGLVADINGETKVFTAANYEETSELYKPTCDAYDGDSYYDEVSVSITPKESENAQSLDITDVLARYQMILQTLEATLPVCVDAASTVWEIYNMSGEANLYLTTLMVPEEYENVRLTDDQRTMITIFAMDQLTQYWEDNGDEVRKTSYTMTKESMSLYCRGNVVVTDYSVDGTSKAVVYEDVIFTPLFSEDYNLKTGMNEITDAGSVMIWGKGQSLSTFDVTDPEMAVLIPVAKGVKLEVAAIMYSGEYVDSLQLNAVNVDNVESDTPIIPDPPKPQPNNDLDELIRLIMVVAGLLILLWGLRTMDVRFIIIGIAVMVAGIIFAEKIENLLQSAFGWEFRWP